MTPSPIETILKVCDQIDEARAKATQGEWSHRFDAILGESYVGKPNSTVQIVALHCEDCMERNIRPENAEFITKAANEITALTKALKLAVKTLEWVKMDIKFDVLEDPIIKKCDESLTEIADALTNKGE